MELARTDMADVRYRNNMMFHGRTVAWSDVIIDEEKRKL